jgi:hypothetical protein
MITTITKFKLPPGVSLDEVRSALASGFSPSNQQGLKRVWQCPALAANRSNLPAEGPPAIIYRWLRDRFRSYAAEAGYGATLIVVPTAREKILSRHSQLSATGERPVLSRIRLLEHLAAFEWPTRDEAAVAIDSSAGLDAWITSEAVAERETNH